MKCHPITTVLLLLLPVAWLACAAPGTGAPSLAYDSWEELMEEVVGPTYEDVLVDEAGKDPEDMDFSKIAAQSMRAARAVALGYGPLEDKTTKGFSELARATEKWLLEIVTEARARRGEELQKLIAVGHTRYCERCHDLTSQ